MIKFAYLLLFFLFLAFTNSSFAENMPVPEQVIQLSYSASFAKDPKYVYYFLKHLDRWYLHLTPEHKKFTLLNSKELKVGTKIKNEESSQGQYLKHLYTVTQFDENGGVFQMVSPSTQIAVWKIFQMQNKTVLTIKIKNNQDGTYMISSDVELVFASKAEKDKALFFKADKIWQKHVDTEMTKALEIIDSFKNDVLD